MNLKQKIWHFTEESTSISAMIVRFSILFLILLSSGLALFEIFALEKIQQHVKLIHQIEWYILIIFTIEFSLRLWASPNKKTFALDKFNIIDFLAIAPFYLGFNNAALLRILRILRLLRVFRLLKQSRILSAFQFRGTILQKVTPLAIFLLVVKCVIWYIESRGIWVFVEDTTILFTIMGFSLGIILSQKIGTTYGKYLDLEHIMFRLHGKISSLAFNINAVRNNDYGEKSVRIWLTKFLQIYHGPDEQGVRKMVGINEELYKKVAKIGNTDLIPHHRFATMLRDMFEDATFILSRKASYTPVAYDKLLQQVTLIFLVLIAIFIPGLNGFITVLLGTYLLYGMYYVTHDFDLAIGDDKRSLIKLRPHRLENYLEQLTIQLGK